MILRSLAMLIHNLDQNLTRFHGNRGGRSRDFGLASPKSIFEIRLVNPEKQSCSKSLAIKFSEFGDAVHNLDKTFHPIPLDRERDERDRDRRERGDSPASAAAKKSAEENGEDQPKR